MKRELAMEFSRTTEAAALASYKFLGCGDKNIADAAAVEAMRNELNNINIDGEIVIGEGEIDEAPMLYIGEKVGTKIGDKVEIAVDPIEGTRMVALGQSNAIAVLAVAEKDTFLKAPDMYMEKMCVGPKAVGSIDLKLPLLDNIKNVAKASDKELKDFTVVKLAKPRHNKVIKEMQDLGVKVFAFPDGDVAASILTCMPFSDVDMMYTIGGAPEGVISAAVIKALGGDMQGRLVSRVEAKGETPENIKISEIEEKRCIEMGTRINTIYTLNEMVKKDDIIFSATGITKGDLVDGMTKSGNIITTETLLIRSKSGTIRRIKSIHDISKKPIFHK